MRDPPQRRRGKDLNLQAVALTYAIYGSMYGMVKTTLYLPEDLKKRVERVSEEKGQSEAQIIRDAIRRAVEEDHPARPRIPLPGLKLRVPRASERVDELLEGFGGE